MLWCKRCFFNKLVFVVVLQSGLALSVFAFRGGNDPARHEVFTAQHPSTQAFMLDAGQIAALKSAKTEGLDVVMRPGWATQISIRGKDLGVRRSYSGGRGLQVKGKGAYGDDAVAVLDNLSPMMAVRHAAKEFAAQKVAGDHLGFHHVRIKQLHQGLKVVGGDLIVHFNNADKAYQVNGSYVSGIEVDIVPAMDADAAVQVALKDLVAFGYGAGRLEDAPELVVFARRRAPVLAYELSLSSLPKKDQAPGFWKYWVDALTGEVISRYNDVKDISAPSANGSNATITGNILLGEGGGIKSVTGWHDNTYSAYYLYNKDRKWFIYNVSTNSSYTDADTYAHRTTSSWGTTDRGEMSGAVCFDATQAYFADVHGRDSYDDANAYARANLHEGVDYVNAFWYPPLQQFFFGDGDGSIADSLVVMDIVGHEFTHAVTEHTADLVYAYEPGALNESFSDIFGACVEFDTQFDGRSYYPSASPGKADWLMGEDSWKSSTALRDMRNPRNAATVGSDGVQPSRYFGENWYAGDGDNGGVHINSGVQNFFFYLLCEGGSGDNDGIGYNFTGIGIADAEQVAYRALTVYCTSSTDYRAVRGAWLSAAADLNPAWVATVDDAWLACGVGPLEIQPNTSVEFEGKQGGAFFPWQHTYTFVNHADSAVSWTLEGSESWLQFSPASGTLAAGASTTISLTLSETAATLAKGVYTDSLTLKKASGAFLGSRQIMLRIGQPDYFTELFSGWDFDLDGLSLTFTPDASDSGYSANALPISSLPTDPSSHTLVSLSDDSYYTMPTLTDGKTVKLYSGSYSRFYIGSNGYITFGSGDSDYSESFEDHFSEKRISAFFDDLNPGAGGSVKRKQLTDRVVVTYIGVPEFGGSNPNTFQIEMFFDGRICLSWLGMAASDGLVGLSDGAGLPDYFRESDLSAFGWDYDGDTIPNWWETQYFGGNTNCNAGIDSDGDGHSNLEEYIAGMHPLDTGSVFHITQQSMQEDLGGTNYVITWNAVEGREYSIWTSGNLIYQEFELLESGMDYPANAYTNAFNQAQQELFYKIGVQLLE